MKNSKLTLTPELARDILSRARTAQMKGGMVMTWEERRLVEDAWGKSNARSVGALLREIAAK